MAKKVDGREEKGAAYDVLSFDRGDDMDHYVLHNLVAVFRASNTPDHLSREEFELAAQSVVSGPPLNHGMIETS